MTRRLDEYPPGSAMSEALLIAAYGGLLPREDDEEPDLDDPEDADLNPEGDPTLNGAFGGGPIERW